MKPVPLIVFALYAGTLFLRAQIGDKVGEAQVPLVPEHLIPPAPVLAPEDELKTFQLAPGYRAELVASDPLIGDPVAMTFGPDGRIWVVEMRGYMPDLDGTTEDQPQGRIVVLTDTDGDGRMDKSEVFLDGIILPRAIALVEGGVLVGAPPYLWFCADKGGKAGEMTELANDFGVQVDPSRPQLANPERAPNALLWGLDNWIYAGAYTAKFQFQNGKWIRDVSTFRGQWGLSQDDWGHLFYNSNSDALRADLVASRYLGRNPHLNKPQGTNWKVANEQFVWPARVNPGINRGYRQESLWTEPGLEYRLKEFTAACAPWIYRGDLFPKDADGNAFICEPAGNLIKRSVLTSENGVLSARNAYEKKEFLASTDERFRPVNLATGPEGALYVVDFYRGVIQHRISLTSYLRSQITQRGLDKPLALGRIWRIVPAEAKIAAAPKLSTQTPSEWIDALSHPNAWRRETAQRLLVEKRDASLQPALELAATSGKEPLGRMHALWTLQGVKAVRWPLIAAALQDEDPRVRAAAVQISEGLLDTPARAELLAKWRALSRQEAVAEVQLQLALSMGEAKDAIIDSAMAALCLRANEVRLLKDAVLSGLAGRELELLETLLANGSQKLPGSGPLLADLARCVFSERKPARVGRCLESLAALAPEEKELQIALFKSLATHPSVNAKYPLKLPAEPAALIQLVERKPPALAPLLQQIRASMVWPGKLGAAEATAATALSSEEQRRFDAGKQLFLGLCAACHQPHGKGMDGLAPPLVDSEWVLGSVERLGRIVLHGVRGPLQVKGAGYNLDMPAMGFLDDAQMASVLTYIRREWEHTASPVSPDTLQQLRRANATRTDAWTQPELLTLP
ncbi:MAG: dehydrogenase [Verrucomicrobia bacterium]|nr:dehydrogenase [Verrucomicrobiota bacterium]